MTRILVVECRQSLRGALHDLLLLSDADHYGVVDIATEVDALAYLSAHSVGTGRGSGRGSGMVVVCSNRDADHLSSAAFFAEVIAHPAWARSHQYLLLSTNRQAIPPPMQRHLAHLRATILPKPFDVEVLLAAVREAAQRVAVSQHPRRDAEQAGRAPRPQAPEYGWCEVALNG
jgi:hypothetical protein